MPEPILTIVEPSTIFSVAGVLHVLTSALVGAHVLKNKHYPAAAISWLGVIVLSPFFGALFYWLFGINRIKRRARAEALVRSTQSPQAAKYSPQANDEAVSPLPKGLMQVGCAIHDSLYLTGNRVDLLNNGVEAYPRMLAAIAGAKKSIVLSSYIFEYDEVGRQFVDALVLAHQRGVEVFVLIDGVGVGYGLSWARSDRELRKHNVPTARFLPALSARGTRFINLRNHRKILSVDGNVAFIGGMNIRAGNMLDGVQPHQTQDVHFSVCGPVLEQINSVFADDWLFATGQAITLPQSNSSMEGNVVSRVLVDGPDDNYEKLELTLLAAINSAKSRIFIATPYFLPDIAIVKALQLAVLRGVDVRLIVPESNNLVFVDWAMQANEKKLLALGVKLYRSQPPFDHSKILITDNEWVLIGSNNWDARSLELNFEIALECFCPEFNSRLSERFAEKLSVSRQVLYQKRSLAAQLRNNFVRLFSPYL